MSETKTPVNEDFSKHSIEAVIRIGLLLLLATWCFKIIQPFIVPTMWGVIIAVAVYPMFCRLRSALGGRSKVAAAIYVLLALALLITPTLKISESIIDTSTHLTHRYEEGTLSVPEPDESVKQWPLIGEDLHMIWSQASDDLEDTLKRYKTQVKKIGSFIVSAAAGTAGSILLFVLSIIISGILLVNAESAYDVTIKIFSRLIDPASGKVFADLSKDTIRSVAQGVLGVALIQSFMAGLGMMVMDVPGWGVWTLLVLVLAIAQLPPILILGFVAAYVFSVAQTTPAVIFLIYCILVSSSDALLKPLFLGRGMEVPMLVILIGAIGGMLMSGIIGLFVGAIILALGYELFIAWLNNAADKVTGVQ